jgi:hypothetical protein
MVQLSFTFTSFILSIPLLSSAFTLEPGVKNYKPSRYMSGLPVNTIHLSFDKDTGELTAYDITHRVIGTLHSSHTGNRTAARQSTASACAAMVNSDIQKRERPLLQPFQGRLIYPSSRLAVAPVHCSRDVGHRVVQQCQFVASIFSPTLWTNFRTSAKFVLSEYLMI